ncbi:MAG TPA: hypothetical protein VGX37_08610 [Allosphingosinicella sp.]|jgi:outer membrane murein-binding lipoprotein Lpp|nr:hypothetical protein [Allosphingosinicella sp.]
MRKYPLSWTKAAAIAGAALLLSGCGGDADQAANDAGANTADANAMLDETGNDASAMESATNAADTAPVANTGSQGTDSPDVLGNTSGGDTGGNTAESNVSGM